MLVEDTFHRWRRDRSLLEPCLNPLCIQSNLLLFHFDGVIQPHYLQGFSIPLGSGIHHHDSIVRSFIRSKPFQSDPYTHCLLLNLSSIYTQNLKVLSSCHIPLSPGMGEHLGLQFLVVTHLLHHQPGLLEPFQQLIHFEHGGSASPRDSFPS